MNYLYEKISTFIALGLTVLIALLLGYELLQNGSILQMLAVSMLIYGYCIYLIARAGYLERTEKHKKTSDHELKALIGEKAPKVTYLVPSYKEEISVIWQTLLSSALQEYPNKEVVLLIDNPPYPENEEDQKLLEETRKLPKAVKNFLAPLSRAIGQYRGKNRIDLANLHTLAAEWFEKEAAAFSNNSHTDQTFIELTFLKRAQKHRMRAEEINKGVTSDEIEKEFLYLKSMLDVEVTSFERKRHKHLSQAPNKAMNLNSYIALMGREKPESEYVAMLDADSILTHDYTARLIYEMEKKGNENLAVIQTPYSAFPNPPGLLEKIAGATTDLQFIVHQGFTRFNATFWVGANAIARKKALDDIAEIHEEGGYQITKYIQDRTVIEDTESSVDLMDKSWKLCNYPERLSYSATPPCFGSLLIQRRRWANGGLLILPKLLRYIFRPPWSFSKFIEGFFRFHYLFSITGVMLSLAALIFTPLESRWALSLTALSSIPYLAIYSRDLKLSGYRYRDVACVMALNFILIPINLAGVVKSIQQGVTGIHTPFCRTPKVAGRIAVPRLYIMMVFFVAIYPLCLIGKSLGMRDWNLLALNSLGALISIYGLIAYLGIREALEDLLTLQQNKNVSSHLQKSFSIDF
jgi:cellulose synthase (UDP-forming)